MAYSDDYKLPEDYSVLDLWKYSDWINSDERANRNLARDASSSWKESPYTTGAMGSAEGMGRSAGYFENLSGGWTAENVLKAHPIFSKFYDASNSETLAKMMNTGVKNFGMRQSADIYKDQGSLYTGLSGVYAGLLGQETQAQMQGKESDQASEAALMQMFGSLFTKIIGQGV